VVLMKKIISLLLMIVAISIIACKPAQKEVPAAGTGDAAVDAVGNDLNTVDTIDEDLSTDEIGDLDTGLSDVENI
jgi:hypothetical protein